MIAPLNYSHLPVAHAADQPVVHDPKAGPRILIVRLSAIGDALHALPVANAIRSHIPEAFIGWVVEGRTGDLLEAHPAIDRLVRVPRKWLKSPSAVWQLRKELRALKFDVAIDVQGLTKSAVAAWLSGAKRRIGFGGSDGRELSWILNNERVIPKGTHVIDRNLELLRPLGISRPRVAFHLPCWPDEAARVDRMLAEVIGPEPFALINPGAGWPSKLWPTDRFAAIARRLGRRHALPSLVVWGSPTELQMAEQIVNDSAGHARLSPPSTLRELAEIARRARLTVASDTGPLHLSVAVGTPSVGLFGPMPGERNGAYGEQHITLQNARLSGSSRERRNADNATMQAILVEQVETACDTLLARKARGAARVA